MFVISTRNFPPELGGIQTLVGGLAENLLNYGPVKIFADKKSDQDNAHDEKSLLDIERISGIKLFRKYRKSGVVNEFVKNQNNIINELARKYGMEVIPFFEGILIPAISTGPAHLTQTNSELLLSNKNIDAASESKYCMKRSIAFCSVCDISSEFEKFCAISASKVSCFSFALPSSKKF